MTIEALLKSKSFDRTLIFGYYGGGNFGDELLLAVIVRLLEQDNEHIEYAYMNRSIHRLLHHDYRSRPRFGIKQITTSLLTSKNIIVGGGGHWGLDANPTVLLLSVTLFIMRHVFRKDIYLIGVGYYGSTKKIGHLSASIAAKAATVILARDQESYEKFKQVSPATYLDKDIAFSLASLPLDTTTTKLDDNIQLDHDHHAVIVAVRNFNDERATAYQSALDTLIAQNPEIPFLLITLEPAIKNQAGASYLAGMAKKYPNVATYSLHHNPLDIVAFFKQHAKNAVLIAPQYHAQLVAHLTGMDFLPISYDNKVAQLHQQVHAHTIPITQATIATMQQFIEA